MAEQLQEVPTLSLSADLKRLRATLAAKTLQVAHLQALVHEIDKQCVSQESQ